MVTDGGERLRMAGDMAGAKLWPTEAEAERETRVLAEAAKEHAEAAKEHAERRALLAEAARQELEAEVARLRVGGSPPQAGGARKRKR